MFYLFNILLLDMKNALESYASKIIPMNIDNNDIEALYLLPKKHIRLKKELENPPLIVHCHGGPHSIVTTEFSPIFCTLAALGFAILSGIYLRNFIFQIPIGMTCFCVDFWCYSNLLYAHSIIFIIWLIILPKNKWITQDQVGIKSLLKFQMLFSIKWGYIDYIEYSLFFFVFVFTVGIVGFGQENIRWDKGIKAMIPLME